MKHQLQKSNIRSQGGYASIILTVVIVSFTLIIGLSTITITLNDLKNTQNYEKSIMAYFTAESGTEDGLIRLKKTLPFTPTYNLSIGNETATITISEPNPLDPTTKQVDSSGLSQDSTQQVRATVNAFEGEEISFTYAIQAGANGFTLDNNATIIGTAYSNGDINMQNNSSITGDAYAVGTISNGDVTNNAFANILDNIDIGNDATYETNINHCSVGGNTYVDTAPVQKPLPALNTAAWKAQAQLGGTHVGNYTANNGETLGPLYITGNLTVAQNATITIEGPLYIDGTLLVDINAIINLDEGFGENGTIIISEGNQDINNNVVFNPTSSGGVLLFVSTSSSLNPGDPAIIIYNNATGVVFHAPNGILYINNNAGLEAASAESMYIDNNAVVTYNSGLADSHFTSGPGGSYNLTKWEIIK